MIDVLERLIALREALTGLRLYALIDGAQYQTHRAQPLMPGSGFHALFDGTCDAPLAQGGPWLIDTEFAGMTFTEDLARLEHAAPAVTWLITLQDLEGLAQLLQLKLDMELPDGRTALLRFWDPRVLANLAEVLDTPQREAFFEHIHEWHLLCNGQRAWVGRSHAQAQ